MKDMKWDLLAYVNTASNMLTHSWLTYITNRRVNDNESFQNFYKLVKKTKKKRKKGKMKEKR